MTPSYDRAVEYFNTVCSIPRLNEHFLPDFDILLFLDFLLQGGEGRLIKRDNTMSYRVRLIKLAPFCDCRGNLQLWGVTLGNEKEDGPSFIVRDSKIPQRIKNKHLITKERWLSGKRAFKDFFSEIK